jgi:hypothetical protein
MLLYWRYIKVLLFIHSLLPTGDRSQGSDRMADCEDDGFDSETLTATPPTRDHDYYNTLPDDHHTLKALLAPPADSDTKRTIGARGNSESIGSLDTNNSGSAVEESDHNYYNEFIPSKAERVLLKPGGDATARWSASDRAV